MRSDLRFCAHDVALGVPQVATGSRVRPPRRGPWGTRGACEEAGSGRGGRRLTRTNQSDCTCTAVRLQYAPDMRLLIHGHMLGHDIWLASMSPDERASLPSNDV